MAATATIRIMSAEEIAALGGGDIPFFRWAEASTLFAERQMRLTQLQARGHALGDFLQLVAAIAKAQQRLLIAGGSVALPDRAAIAAARASGLPPLSPERLPRTPWWRDVLRALLDDVLPGAPEAIQTSLKGLRDEDDEQLERRADAVLKDHIDAVDLAAAPFVGAALQVYWAHATHRLQLMQASDSGYEVTRTADLSRCPACGSCPVASITRTINSTPGHRYLHCSLCAGEWHRVRTDCTHCSSSRSLAYQSLDHALADSGDVAADDAARSTLTAIQAETCDDCNHYLKIMHTDRDPLIEVGADDLTSITLDLLVAETGKRRYGRNLMLLFASDPASPTEAVPDPGAT